MENSNGAGKITKYIIGIDEVGRGPIAGPVAVCAFLCNYDFFENFPPVGLVGKKTSLPKLKDSKKLSKKQREEWFEYLKGEKVKGNCDFAVSYVSAEMIDKFGIVKAIQKALDNSLEKLDFQKDTFVYLDGGLKAPVEYINQQTIIKGDELHPVISCASIIAKVSRDKIMANHAKEYPEYGFEKHSGYGTKFHYEAIKKHGPTLLHRKTFLKSIK
ncbi:ribonuclease HII [Candidatus Nomurabacteria bacterium]|nr:ribonuclease HII [Candidatus Nomurabacteria bacterium]